MIRREIRVPEFTAEIVIRKHNEYGAITTPLDEIEYINTLGVRLIREAKRLRCARGRAIRQYHQDRAR